MDALIMHIQTRWPAYLGVMVCALPLLYVFRKTLVPLVSWVLEIAAYMVLIHFVLHGTTRVAKWFKVESSFRYALEEGVIPEPGWVVPIRGFWKPALYNPHWIPYFELVLFVIIIIAVSHYRPIRAQKFRPQQPALTKGLGLGNQGKGRK